MEAELPYAVFNVSWENAWKNERNHDAVWLFFKSESNSGQSKHIKVQDKGHNVIASFTNQEPRLAFKVPSDRMGLFLHLDAAYRGNINVTISVQLSPSSFEGINTRQAEFKAFGLEMVHIPSGEFTLGDIDSASVGHGAFFKPGKNGKVAGLVTIKSEHKPLTIANNGHIFYRSSEGYEGDQQGEIPTSFPKGIQPFYTMKYELSESRYVEFLNSLSATQSNHRSMLGESNYEKLGGKITLLDDRYVTTVEDKPCQFVGWDDAMAYADWAGLRPMTEFEFTKAARGPGKPIKKGFPWGSNKKQQIQRLPDQTGKLSMINGWDESQMSDDHKIYFGASYYWVMDLAGSLWERVISVGHEIGRKYVGNHGDGMLDEKGNANTVGWPVGDENLGGVGFRGGGFYGYSREYHEFNPFSPIAFRPYGGWHGTMRAHAYGTRFVRTDK